MNETIFPRGRIIPSEDVISRSGFVEDLEERLFVGDNIALFSPRRTGKTSVACGVLRKLRERGCYTVYINLFHVVSPAEIGLRLLRGAQQIIGVGSIANEDVVNEAYRRAEETAKARGTRIVVVFDEWQEIDRIGGEALLKRLRSIFQHQSLVSYLFVGSEIERMRTLFANRRQAFYEFATMLHLPDISGDEWREYVNFKFGQAGMTIGDDSFNELVKVTGGYPYDVMTVLREAEIQLRLSHKNDVDLPLMQSSIERSFGQLEAVYDELWKRVLEIKGANKVLLPLAEGRFWYHDDDAMKKARRQLVNMSILTGPQRGKYQFVETMFARWLGEKRRL